MNALLVFPHLHPGLAGELPAGVRLLDPGLGSADDPAWLRPGDLPIGPEELAGYVREFDRLRREVKNPKDLALLAGTTDGHFFAETSFAVRQEMEDALDPGRVALRRARAAQLALCLTAMVEESLLELATAGELDVRFRRAMAESLGLEADDETEELALALAATATLPPAAALAEEFRPPWRQTLPAFWAVAPAGAGLYIADADIVETLTDAGIAFAPLSPEDAAAFFPDGPPAGALLAATLPGWRLAGRTRPDPGAPWLDAPRPVVVVAP
ncbi:MAG: hypothetical protein ACP59X_12535 [Solidesulfovibrio sp. DCME]|uniref:hypothetical protein n=1 Tax=Solidesulfovibrio sp. DCME TaxID=3447380 RepID=UPI003D0B7735